MGRTLKAADLFCGAGGTSTGLLDACTELGIRAELTAINHWDIADRGDMALCQPFVIAIDHHGGNSNQTRDAAEPLSAITTKQRHAVVQPYLVKFYGNSEAASVAEPLDTVTTKDRYGLCQPIIEIDGERYLLDIHFRMLKPHELARAQGFPVGYKFEGTTTEVVKQIGNAVPAGLAKALVKSALSQAA